MAKKIDKLKRTRTGVLSLSSNDYGIDLQFNGKTIIFSYTSDNKAERSTILKEIKGLREMLDSFDEWLGENAPY